MRVNLKLVLQRPTDVWAQRLWFALALLSIAVVYAVLVMLAPPRTASPQAEDAPYLAAVSARTAATTDQRITALQDRLRVQPDAWQLQSQLGLLYLRRARESGDPSYYQRAEIVLQQALTAMPDDYTANAAMGTLALARHRFQEALEWGNLARRINPDRPFAYGVLVDALVELGRYSEAVATLERMADLRVDQSVFTRISYLRELYGDMPGAIQAMQQAAEGVGPTGENSAWIHTQLGHLYFNNGWLSQAQEIYSHALTIEPRYVYALAGLARVRFAQGHREEAIGLLEEAMRIAPIPGFVVALGDMHQVLGNQEEAQRLRELMNVMQQLYEANGVVMDMEMALFNANWHADPAAAVVQARAAYAERPSIYGADTLAWALYRAGRFQEAWLYAQKALQLGTHDALIYFHAGMIGRAVGETARAQTYLAQALNINPHFSVLHARDAQAALAELQSSSRY